MEYSNQLTVRQPAATSSQLRLDTDKTTLCPPCHNHFALSVPPPRKAKNKHLWQDTLRMWLEQHDLFFALAGATNEPFWYILPDGKGPRDVR